MSLVSCLRPVVACLHGLLVCLAGLIVFYQLTVWYIKILKSNKRLSSVGLKIIFDWNCTSWRVITLTVYSKKEKQNLAILHPYNIWYHIIAVSKLQFIWDFLNKTLEHINIKSALQPLLSIKCFYFISFITI